MGYRHYSEFALKPNMASSPLVVMPFLQEMSKMVRPSADKVLYLSQYKYDHCYYFIGGCGYVAALLLYLFSLNCRSSKQFGIVKEKNVVKQVEIWSPGMRHITQR